jgi:hypothetical protein
MIGGLPAENHVWSTILWRTGRMPGDPFALRQLDQARTNFAIIEDELMGFIQR